MLPPILPSEHETADRPPPATFLQDRPPEWPPTPPPGMPTPDRTALSRTKTGLALLILAVFLLWIPVIEYLGLLLGAIGAILMILGRRPFGARHETLVWASVILFILTYAAEFVVLASFANSVFGIGSSTGPSAATAFLGAWRGLEEASLAAVALMGVCFALIAFDLEDLPGRLLLLAGVACQVVVSVYLLVVVIDPILTQAVTRAFASNPVDLSVIEAADAQISGLGALRVLNAIPALVFAAAYAWAWRRIDRGVIPRTQGTRAA